MSHPNPDSGREGQAYGRCHGSGSDGTLGETCPLCRGSGSGRLRITAAAIRKNGVVYEGTRHAYIMSKVFEETGERVSQDEQGFVASDGKFYNRFQAGAIAFNAGQTKVRHQSLLSEHVW